MSRFATRFHPLSARLINLAIFVQLFLAGAHHAGYEPYLEIHIFLGLALIVIGLLTLIAALGGRLGSRVVLMSLVLFLLLLAQPFIIEQRRAGMPFLSAFHAANAGLIGALSALVSMAGARVIQAQKAAPGAALAGATD
jgi:hypothetical protein